MEGWLSPLTFPEVKFLRECTKNVEVIPP